MAPSEISSVARPATCVEPVRPQPATPVTRRDTLPLHPVTKWFPTREWTSFPTRPNRLDRLPETEAPFRRAFPFRLISIPRIHVLDLRIFHAPLTVQILPVFQPLFLFAEFRFVQNLPAVIRELDFRVDNYPIFEADHEKSGICLLDRRSVLQRIDR